MEKREIVMKPITIPIFCCVMTLLGCWTIDKSMTALQNDAGFVMIIVSFLLLTFYYDQRVRKYE